jgi:hypothetical protein
MVKTKVLSFFRPAFGLDSCDFILKIRFLDAQEIETRECGCISSYQAKIWPKYLCVTLQKSCKEIAFLGQRLA